MIGDLLCAFIVVEASLVMVALLTLLVLKIGKRLEQ